MTTKGLGAKVIIGMLLGGAIGYALMRFAPVPLQPGDTIKVAKASGEEFNLTIASEDKSEKLLDVILDDGGSGTAVLERAQTDGHVKLPNGQEVEIAGMQKDEALQALNEAAGEEYQSVKLQRRAGVSILPPAIQPFFLIGELFMRLLKMLIVPLIVATVLVGIASLDNIGKMGRIGYQTLGFYVVTMLLAATTGLILVNLIRPGDGARDAFAEWAGSGVSQSTSVMDMILRIVPTNPVEALARMDVLGMLFFTIILALAILKVGKRRAAPVFNFFEGLNDLIYVLIGWLMALAPFGVGALIAYFVGIQDPQFIGGLLVSLGKFAMCAYLGLFVHFVVLSSAVHFLGRYNPFKFIKIVTPALVTAFGTDSSSATMPVTMSVVRDANVSKRIAGFVVPVGATANMDGTALYEAVAVLFFAQAYRVDLTIGQQIIVAFTAMFAAVGAAGIPAAGLITMALVLTAVGLPIAGIALLFAIDRPIDMLRTVINVYGDATTSRIVQTWNPDIKPEEDDQATEYEEVAPSASHGR